MNRHLLRASIVVALGGLLFGFDIAVIAGTTQQLTGIFFLTPFALGLTVFIGLLGTVLGSTCSGILGQKIGGRDALRVMAVLYTISGIGCAFAWDWHSLLFYRFVGGLGIGGTSVLAPVYLAELAPPHWRGRLVGLFQINIVSGILLAYLSNFIIASQHLGASEWRWEFGVAIWPSLLFFSLLFAVPRSARWLVTVNREPEARGVLALLGLTQPDVDLLVISNSVQIERGIKEEPLFTRRHRVPIFLALSIGVLNQLTGINAVIYYSNYIFVSAGFSSLSSGLQTVSIGLVNLAANLLGMSLIDKAGRKTLLLIGSVGMAFALGGVAEIFFSQKHQGLLVWLLIIYIFCFAISQGSVIRSATGNCFGEQRVGGSNL